MSNKKSAKDLNKVEILDFDDEPTIEEINETNKSTKKNKILSIIFIIIGIIVVIAGIVITKIMIENNDSDNNSKKENKEEIKYDINISEKLKEFQNTNNYIFENNINVYTNGDSNSIYKINNKFVYNENKYKLEKNQTVQNIEYKNTNYYIRNENEIFEYFNDLTSDTYTRNAIDENNYNSRIVFDKFIEYLINNNEVIKENIINIDNNEMIKVTLKTNKDILNTISIDNNLTIDTNKISISDINIDLYFNKSDEKLNEICFKLEDKHAYQGNINTEIDYSTIIFKFYDFNKVSDIELPY